jgi:hypothetical protein
LLAVTSHLGTAGFTASLGSQDSLGFYEDVTNAAVMFIQGTDTSILKGQTALA